MKKSGTIKFYFLALLIFSISNLNAQSLSVTDSIIYKCNSINGLSLKDSVLFDQIISTLQSEPFDSIDFDRIKRAIENRKVSISKDVYVALKYALSFGLYNRNGKTNVDKSIDFGLELLAQLKNPESSLQHDLLIMSLSEIRRPYRSGNRINEGIKYFTDLIHYYKQQNDSEVVSVCYYCLSGCYRTLGLTERAIDSQKKSISYLSEKEIKPKKAYPFGGINNLIGMGGIMYRKIVLAQHYINNNEPIKALPLINDAIYIYDQIKDFGIYENPCYIYIQAARANALLHGDSSDYYFNRAASYKNEELTFRVNYYQERGFACYLRGNYEAATLFLDSSILIKDSFEVGTDSPYGNLIPRYYLALVKCKQQNYSEAIKLLLKELKEVASANQPAELLKHYLLLAQVYTQANDFAHATKYYELYSQIQSEIIKNEKVNRSINFETEQAINQKETEALQHAKDNEVNRRNNYLLIALASIILIVAIGLLYRIRLKRKIEMERMRNRLSRDLHDDIGSTLSSINILSSTAQANLQQTHSDESGEQTKQSLEKINERSQRLLDNMSDIIWNINPGNDTLEEVMSRMREYATTILDAKNIDFTFEFPKQNTDYKLAIELKNNLYLIFKEAVNNLSKYSGCTKANLSLTFDDKNIHLRIEDNGIGFNDAEIKHRGGLRNMQHRAEELKGSLKITSALNKGTTVEVTITRHN